MMMFDTSMLGKDSKNTKLTEFIGSAGAYRAQQPFSTLVPNTCPKRVAILGFHQLSSSFNIVNIKHRMQKLILHRLIHRLRLSRVLKCLLLNIFDIEIQKLPQHLYHHLPLNALPLTHLQKLLLIPNPRHQNLPSNLHLMYDRNIRTTT
jgi:hypothetical protein